MYDSCISFTPSFEGCAAPGTPRLVHSIRSLRPCPEAREVRRAFVRLPATLPTLSFQSLPTIKLNYPTRIVHPERSEGSLCKREVAAHPNPFRLYSFQQLTTVKFCNHFVLITIQNAGEWVYPLSYRHPSFSLSAVNCRLLPSLTPLECAVPRFRVVSSLECADPKMPRCNSFRMRSYKKSGGRGSLFLRSPLVYPEQFLRGVTRHWFRFAL
jgi:hypothetical protein